MGLLTEKSNTKKLLEKYSIILIRAIKSVDKKVVGIEKLKQWHRLKVCGIFLIRYLGEKKMELLYQEIKLSSKIKQKTIPQLLINKA